MLYNLFENRDFVSVFAVALLAEGVDRNIIRSTSAMESAWSPSSQRAWIEIRCGLPWPPGRRRSPSSQRAWIEITTVRSMEFWGSVALLAEGVDRNHPVPVPVGDHLVALLAEGVDRNNAGVKGGAKNQVALLAEGVDRNTIINHILLLDERRPPRRGRG